MKIKYIFFDFDGVLAESVNIKTEAFRKMYFPYGNDFAQKVVDHHLANGGMSRYEKVKVYNGEWLGEEITPEKIQILSQIFSDLVVDGVVNCEEVLGTNDFLTSANDYRKYIITGTPTIEIIPILERRNMSHFFEKIYGSPEKKDFWVKEILSKENILPEDCIFIGDALADYNAALANDVTFILRETKEAELLFKDYKGMRIKNLLNLHEVINKINTNRG
jgi:phosphoglycolate phosphatase-like HAD superfamily hydrolase